jgi:hypothetical protein
MTNYELRKKKKFLFDSIREWCEDRYIENKKCYFTTIGQASRRFSNINLSDLVKIFPPKNPQEKQTSNRLGQIDFYSGSESDIRTYGEKFCDSYTCLICKSDFESAPRMPFCRECGYRCGEEECTYSYGRELTTSVESTDFYICRQRIKENKSGVLVDREAVRRQTASGPESANRNNSQKDFSFRLMVEPTVEELMKIEVRGELLPPESDTSVEDVSLVKIGGDDVILSKS